MYLVNYAFEALAPLSPILKRTAESEIVSKVEQKISLVPFLADEKLRNILQEDISFSGLPPGPQSNVKRAEGDDDNSGKKNKDVQDEQSQKMGSVNPTGIGGIWIDFATLKY